jgi:hypothetical protein
LEVSVRLIVAQPESANANAASKVLHPLSQGFRIKSATKVGAKAEVVNSGMGLFSAIGSHLSARIT